MRILVTGGAGYIGSHTCKALTHQGHTVIVYDNLSTGHRELVRWGDFVFGDILDTQRLRACIRQYRIEGIIHFAASAYVGESVVEPGKYFRNNVCGTLSILDAMRDEGVPYIVVSGTCAVYGSPDNMPIIEDTPANPINPYGASKLFMERMLADFENAHGIRWISLRYFNAAGCDPDGETGEWHEPETHLIPRALMAAIGKIPALEIFGGDYPTPDGTCVRDYVHVSDLADAHLRSIDFLSKGKKSHIINLGAEKGTSIYEVISTVKEVTGVSVPYIISPKRTGDPPILQADSTKAKIILEWKPKYSNLNFNINSSFLWINKYNK
ncbi:UDP-glucose 4-epimerase GalE [Desulfomicrobium escambiense]|uniref:UDP-glucose 4-epimerase GalE n=1 Tax=Desulfomicrobium escambiense TaxID=29503 RepID=UPI000684E8B6|nr:UDP-glucose 4-epimerase GalE [Desulfomicrobium escambiense]